MVPEYVWFCRTPLLLTYAALETAVVAYIVRNLKPSIRE